MPTTPNPVEVLRDALAHGLPGRRGGARIGAVASILAGGRKFAEMNFRSGCEAADMLAARLDMPQAVRDSLACTFERWNGKGQPNRVKAERIPLPMRIVHLAQDAEALARLRSPAEAIAVIRERSGGAYDPALADAFLRVAGEMFAPLEKLDPRYASLACEPEPRRLLTGSALDEALEVAADFIDLKSPFTAGHSRQVAGLAAAACERAGLPPAEVQRARRAGLLHAEVLALVAAGLTTAQIAERFVISPKTADSHIQHIYTKIGCSTRAAASCSL